MPAIPFCPTRRQFVAASAASLFLTPGAFAEELTRTPRQTEGPFYPDKLPLDTDNDLLVINDTITPAVGEITHFSGRILDAVGSPLKNVVVEIWQCDANGGVPAQPDRQPSEEGRQLPGVRSVHHGGGRGILLPDDQAGPVPRPDAAHSRQGEAGRQRVALNAVLHQGPRTECPRRYLAERPRPEVPRRDHRGIRPGEGIEDR